MQIIAMPAPLSGWASGCAITGTSTPNRGEVTVVPNRPWYRSSSGWATSATHAGSSSGRVVSMYTVEPVVSAFPAASLRVKPMRW